MFQQCYLVALNEYDMLLEEDNITNRLDESLKLFQRLSGSQWIRNSAMILFLNKLDIFQQCIEKRPLGNYFHDYDEFTLKHQEFTELERSCEYVKDQFTRAFSGSRLYFFVTCALDTDNCEKVFLAVRDSILSRMINNSGFPM